LATNKDVGVKHGFFILHTVTIRDAAGVLARLKIVIGTFAGKAEDDQRLRRIGQ
jgi:hypothetical protein